MSELTRRKGIASVAARNGGLVALVAGVAVGGVLIGGGLAAQTGPVAGSSQRPAMPLPVVMGSGGVPTRPPTVRPKPRPPSVTQIKVPETKVVLAKLPTGRVPQLSYLDGRKILGGAGSEVTIPGKQEIRAAGRLGSDALAVLGKDSSRSELVHIREPDGVIARIPDVGTLVTSADGDDAAYASERFSSDGAPLKGGVVYFHDASGAAVRKLARPDDFEVRALAIVDRTVYFSASPVQTGLKARLYRWDVDTSRAREVPGVVNPTAVSGSGAVAAGVTAMNDSGTCSAVFGIDTGAQTWRTCEYQLDGFTPDDRTVLAAPAMRDGYADTMAAALDASNGDGLRRWTGISIRGVVPEDDDHLLMIADDGPETKAAIIRCTISTGQCELATPLAEREIALGR